MSIDNYQWINTETSKALQRLHRSPETAKPRRYIPHMHVLAHTTPTPNLLQVKNLFWVGMDWFQIQSPEIHVPLRRCPWKMVVVGGRSKRGPHVRVKLALLKYYLDPTLQTDIDQANFWPTLMILEK